MSRWRAAEVGGAVYPLTDRGCLLAQGREWERNDDAGLWVSVLPHASHDRCVVGLETRGCPVSSVWVGSEVVWHGLSMTVDWSTPLHWPLPAGREARVFANRAGIVMPPPTWALEMEVERWKREP